MNHLSNWIEIPAVDIVRARAFYETVLQVELTPFEQGDLRYAFFPARSVHNTGALVQGPGYVPSTQGPLVYLDGAGRMDAILERVERAGGTILMPRTLLSPEAGEVGMFLDGEGNRIGLQASVVDPIPVSDSAMQQLLGSTAPGVAFLLRRGPAYGDATAPLQWEHARNMFALLRSGKLRSVVALTDGTDVLGLGLWVGDRAEAEAVLAQDPAIRGGRLTYELLTDVTFDAASTRF
jgi:uncharacterized protein